VAAAALSTERVPAFVRGRGPPEVLLVVTVAAAIIVIIAAQPGQPLSGQPRPLPVSVSRGGAAAAAVVRRAQQQPPGAGRACPVSAILSATSRSADALTETLWA
jgi:hypothetical protein